MDLKKICICAAAAVVLPLAAEVKAYFIELKHNDKKAEQAYLAQPFRFWTKNAYKTHPDKYNGLLVLSNSRVNYVFHLFGTLKNGMVKNLEIGMRRPSPYNWYAGGFLAIQAGKHKLTAGKFAVSEVKGGSQSGYAELSFTDSPFTGKIRFELADDDDKLQLIFTPSSPQAYRIRLTAYPGAYGDAKRRVRKMITNLGEVEGNSKKLTPQDFWCVFGDSYYDRQYRRGDGCCAFLFNPKEILPGSILRSGYACLADLYGRQGKPTSLILWDFKGCSISQAVSYMKKLDVKFE